jgi:hypothetical protein
MNCNSSKEDKRLYYLYVFNMTKVNSFPGEYVSIIKSNLVQTKNKKSQWFPILTVALLSAEFICVLSLALALLHGGIPGPIRHAITTPDAGGGGLFVALIEFDWVIN